MTFAIWDGIWRVYKGCCPILIKQDDRRGLGWSPAMALMDSDNILGDQYLTIVTQIVSFSVDIFDDLFGKDSSVIPNLSKSQTSKNKYTVQISLRELFYVLSYNRNKQLLKWHLTHDKHID